MQPVKVKDAWLTLVDHLLTPARPRLEACQRTSDEQAARLTTRKNAALLAVQKRIEAAREDVFTARDGVVGATMTTLEREWRRVAKGDPDGELMDLWAAMAPRAWLDRKRWRDAPPAEQRSLAVMLAADPEGVERAEAAATRIRPIVRWLPLSKTDFDGMAELLSGVVPVAAVREAVLARFPERPIFAGAVAYAAGAPTHAHPFYEIFRAGYAIASVDERSITLATDTH